MTDKYVLVLEPKPNNFEIGSIKNLDKVTIFPAQIPDFQLRASSIQFRIQKISVLDSTSMYI